MMCSKIFCILLSYSSNGCFANMNTKVLVNQIKDTYLKT